MLKLLLHRVGPFPLAALAICAGAAKGNNVPARPIPFEVIATEEPLTSRQGQPIQAVRIAQTKTPSHFFYIQSGLHGNELLPVEFTRWLAFRIASQQSPLNALTNRGVALDFVFVANPDGFAKKTRSNSAGVNLNRNFSVLWGQTGENPGGSSLSEPETQAVKYFLKKTHYTAAVDVHGYRNWFVVPSPDGIISEAYKRAAPHGALAAAYENWVADLLAIKPENYMVQTAGGLGDGGAFEDFAFWATGTPAFCLEMSSSERFEKTNDTFERYEKILTKIFTKALQRNEHITGLDIFINRLTH